MQALGLGADAVLLGRPVLHGLALNGQQGVEDVINTLKAELRLNMALAGAAPPKPHSVIYTWLEQQPDIILDLCSHLV